MAAVVKTYPMRTFVKRLQIPLFFALTLLIGWLPWYTGRGGVIMVAPTLAGLLVAFLADGKEGLLAVLRRLIRWRAGVRWYALILLAPVLTSLAAVGVHVLLGGAAPQFPLIRENQHLILLTFLFYLLPWQSSAFLEEVGLRGYAQEQVQNKWGPLGGTLVLGLFFGAWLLPEFLRPGSNQAAMGGLAFYPWFILTEIGWSLLMAWVYNRTNKSALIAGYLFHTAFNVWPFVLLSDAVPGEALPAFDTRL
ncbi:MAG: type II CAAX prenyl endopeptidase Rce1 family protein, partial [Anaerolineae bacterium]